jgi:hypothetical protein
MQSRPSAAFILSLIGGLFILILSAIYLLFMIRYEYFYGAYFNYMMYHMISFHPYMFTIVTMFATIGLISGALVIVGSFFINSDNIEKVRTGGILVIVFSVLSIVSGGGFFIGFILSLIGGILAITWQPSNISNTTISQSKTIQ